MDRINYIKEINAFYDWLETNSVSTSSIVLWHALMAINNKARWTVEFAVAVSVLCVKTGLSPRAISNARNELKQKGRIDWKQRKGNQSAVYTIIPFLSATGAYNRANNTTDNGANNDLSAPHADSCTDNASCSTSDKCADNASTLYKLNKTKLNSNNDHDHVGELNFFSMIESEFGRPLSPMEIERVMYWVNQDQVPDVLIAEAVRRAVMRGKVNFRYIDAILMDWSKKNLRTLEDVAELDRQFKERKGGDSKAPKAFAGLQEWVQGG